MNTSDRSTARTPTQAAEGLPRWRWTLDEFERFIDLGIFSEADRVELIGGELVPMSPKGARHDNLRTFLQAALQRRLQPEVFVHVEIGWRPDEAQYVEPDILIAELGADPVRTPAGNVLLLIEVADSSLSYDLKIKSRVYAALGVGEYWVVDAARLVTHVHRDPSAAGYAKLEAVPSEGELTVERIPGLMLRLADLGVKPA